MLRIKEYDLTNLEKNLNNEIKNIDDNIKSDLNKISAIKVIRPFFDDLNKIVDLKSDFSFIKANGSIIQTLINVDTSLNISNLNTFNQKFKLLSPYLKSKRKKKQCTLNDILEFIFGYHLEERTQILKTFIKTKNFDNCAYCLAQYTTAYESRNKRGKIYVKGNLDHIYPKSLNALVSLSLNNLVPVCAHCNQRKLNANLSNFNFNPFEKNVTHLTPTFKFNKVLNISGGIIKVKDINELTLANVNSTLEKRLEITALYKEYKTPIINLLDRYNKFNSKSYQDQLEHLIKKGISSDLEYFISETPYTEENIQNLPLHKFKSDFYKELERYKKNGEIKFS